MWQLFLTFTLVVNKGSKGRNELSQEILPWKGILLLLSLKKDPKYPEGANITNLLPLEWIPVRIAAILFFKFSLLNRTPLGSISSKVISASNIIKSPLSPNSPSLLFPGAGFVFVVTTSKGLFKPFLYTQWSMEHNNAMLLSELSFQNQTRYLSVKFQRKKFPITFPYYFSPFLHLTPASK